MDRNLLRIELLERLGQYLERSSPEALGPQDIYELRRILVRRNELAFDFAPQHLLQFGRTVFEVQCAIRRREGLQMPRRGPLELIGPPRRRAIGERSV